MSDSADAIGGLKPDWDARLNFQTPTNHSVSATNLNSKAKVADEGGDQNQRLSFPAANLGRLRSADPESLGSETKKPVEEESAALKRKRQREKQREEQRQRVAAKKAERLARQLTIEEGEELEVDWRKRYKLLMAAWAVGLLFNILILVCLGCYVASWGRDQKPLTLTFSAIELQAEDQPEIDFSLPVEVTTEENEAEAEVDQMLVEVLTVDAEMDWSEEQDLVLDPLDDALFEAVDPGGSADPGDSDREVGKKGTSFFGLESRGDRLVFVVDCSGSMGYERRFQRAVYELGQSLRLMEANQEFLVVLYNDGIYPMLDTPLKQTKPLRATDGNVERVMTWVRYQRPAGFTLPARAIRGALEVKPSSIFFLSDGELDDNTIGMLRELNVSNSATGARKVPIHTITLGSTGAGAGTMKQIAQENNGRFTWAK